MSDIKTPEEIAKEKGIQFWINHIEDYIGGNVLEGEVVDMMALTRFLRSTLTEIIEAERNANLEKIETLKEVIEEKNRNLDGWFKSSERRDKIISDLESKLAEKTSAMNANLEIKGR